MTSSRDSFFSALRGRFPALRRQTGVGQPVAYLDGAAGTQVPREVIATMVDYLERCNANRGGRFATSQESDRWLDQAHQAAADFVGATDASEVYFGPNMTTLTFALSRALARRWNRGDEILLTRSEHDANYTPWVLAARDAGAVLRHVEVNKPDGTLQLDTFYEALSERTRLLAVGLASNATGTVHPVAEMVQAARQVGAMSFVDAVHYAPHRRLNVAALGCDFLACSPYKFFGPHQGIVWGRGELLRSLEPYKLRPAPDCLPGKWMTGTQNHEAIAGTMGAIDYLASIGRQLASGCASPATLTRSAALDEAFTQIESYERHLMARLMGHVAQISGLTVWGIRDPSAQRLPTLSFTHPSRTPRQIADLLANEGLFVWHGNFYALPLSEAFGLEPDGMVRVGLVHYNTVEEVDRLAESLRRILVAQ